LRILLSQDVVSNSVKFAQRAAESAMAEPMPKRVVSVADHPGSGEQAIEMASEVPRGCPAQSPGVHRRLGFEVKP